MPPRPKVLSIVGTGRSGTTIVSSILDEIPGVFGAGELRWLWSRDLVEQRMCGCGSRPAQCPVWSRVVEEVLGIPGAEQGSPRLAEALQEVRLAQDYVGALRNRRQVLASQKPHRPRPPEFARLAARTVSLLDALFAATGTHTIVDASKRPEEAAVVAASGRFDHYVLHMVRDPRAVVYSWGRSKPLPEATGQSTIGTRSPPKTVLRWNENAVGAEWLRRQISADKWLFIRYEDFAEHPQAAIRQVTDFLGEQSPPPFIADDTVLLGQNHNLSGNPNRFKTGPVRIVPDREWKQRMPRRQQLLIQAATLPFLLKYGYPILP